MSIIAYVGGILVGDRVAKRDQHGVDLIEDMQKIFVNSTKQFAYAQAGYALIDRLRPEMEEVILAALLKSYTEGGSRLVIADKYKNFFVRRTTIIATRDRAYREIEDGLFQEFDPDGYEVSGTMEYGFLVALKHYDAYPGDIETVDSNHYPDTAIIAAAKKASSYLSGQNEALVNSINVLDLHPIMDLAKGESNHVK